jgi:ribosome-associated protein
MAEPLRVTFGLLIPAADLTYTAARSSGPGGQNVNKVSSKIELRFDLEGTTALQPSVKARLRALAGSRLDADGRVRVVSQKTRDQARNREDARDKLPTRPTLGSKRRRRDDKKHRGDTKQLRRRIGSDD